MEEKERAFKLPGMTEGEKKALSDKEKELGRPLEEIPNHSPDGMCFGCGRQNPIGCHLRFFWLSDGCVSFFTVPREFEGYHTRIHGGISAVLLDEVIGNYLLSKYDYPFYTARMDVRYKEGVPIGDTVSIECHVVKHKVNLIVVKGRITLSDGTVAVEATEYMMGEKQDRALAFGEKEE